MSRHLVFGAFPRCNVLSSSDQPAQSAGVIPHREASDPYPPDRSVGSNNSKLFVKLSGSHRLFKASQNPDAVFGMKKFLIRNQILSESLAGTASYILKCLVDVDDLFCVCVKHPENLLDIAGHLLEALIAFENCSLSLTPLGNVAQDSNVAAGQGIRFGRALHEDYFAITPDELHLAAFVFAGQKSPPAVFESLCG